MHRTDPACAACHPIIDPFGLALEPFDLVGRWREQEAGQPIDATTELVGRHAPRGARRPAPRAVARSDAFVTALTERLLTYALGRELEHYDQPVVRSVIRQAAADGTTLAALVQAIVASDAFRKRIKAGPKPRRGAGAALTSMPRTKTQGNALLPPGVRASPPQRERIEDNPALHAIWDVVAQIPRGSVWTYGDVAREAGLPGAHARPATR